jgi:hypothetical protein
MQINARMIWSDLVRCDFHWKAFDWSQHLQGGAWLYIKYNVYFQFWIMKDR